METSTRKAKIVIHALVGPLLAICPRELSLSEKNVGRVSRSIAVCVMCALCIGQFIARSTEFRSTSAVAQSLREAIFPTDAEGVAGRISDQRYVPGVGMFTPADGAINVLSALQSACRDQALSEDTMVEWLDCDIQRIDWGPLHANPTFEDLPCNDEAMDQMVEAGDREAFHELPTALKNIYKENQTPKSKQVTPVYNINQGDKFSKPLFNTEPDEESGKLGPLPSLNHKLNLIGQALGHPSKRFKENSWRFGPSSAAPRAPPKEGEAKAVELNHHWDVLFRCQPDWVQVNFYVATTQRQTQDLPNLWWEIQLEWHSIGNGLNYYATQVDVATGSAYAAKSTWSDILVVSCLGYFAISFLPGAIVVVFRFFQCIVGLLLGSRSFPRYVAMLHRSQRLLPYVPLVQTGFEDVASLLFLVGLICSALDLVNPYGSSSVHRGFEVQISALESWREVNLSAFDFAIQLMRGMFCMKWIFSWAITLWFIRAMDLSLMSPRTAFLLATFALALPAIANFLVIFIVIVFAYSTVIYIEFGDAYAQFHSMRQTFWCLLLYSFSFTDASAAEDQVHPFVEQGAYSLQLLLLSFQVVVVTILLNMFTTIVLDAYNAALELRADVLTTDHIGRLFLDRLVNLWGVRTGADVSQIHNELKEIRTQVFDNDPELESLLTTKRSLSSAEDEDIVALLEALERIQPRLREKVGRIKRE